MGKVTQKLNKIIISGLVFTAPFLSALSLSTTAHAASIQASATSVTIGETFTISVQFQAAAWDVQFYTTGPTNDCSLHDVDVTLDGMSTAKTFSRTCVANGAGTVTAILSGTVSDANGNETPISGNTSIMVMTAPDPTPAKPSIPEDTVVPPALTPEPAETTNDTPETSPEEPSVDEISDDEAEEDSYKAPLSATTVNRRSSGGSSGGSSHTFTTLTSQSSTETGPSGLLIVILVAGILITLGNVIAFIILKKRKGKKAKKPLAKTKDNRPGGKTEKTQPKTVSKASSNRSVVPTHGVHKHIVIPAPSTMRISRVPTRANSTSINHAPMQSQTSATPKTATMPSRAKGVPDQALGYASYHETMPQPGQQEIAKRLAETYSPMPTFGISQAQGINAAISTAPKQTHWESPSELMSQSKRVAILPKLQSPTAPNLISSPRATNLKSSTLNLSKSSTLNTPGYGNLSASCKTQAQKQKVKSKKKITELSHLFQNFNQMFKKINPLPLVHGLRRETPAVVSSPLELNSEMLDEFRDLMNS